MILITGGRGKLGSELIKLFPKALVPGREELDITDTEKVKKYISEHKPDIIIHLAAFTNVREAEKNKPGAYKANVEGTENLVQAALDSNSRVYFVYMSTACVFRGDRGNYSEEDIPDPKNFYATTKLIGEFIAKKVPNHLVIRSNFVAREPWPYPKAFTDRFGTYLFADDLAKAIKDTVDKKMIGLVHIAGDKKLSMYELAELAGSKVGEMTMADTDLPLTRDMTLVSVKIPHYKITV